MKEIEVMQGPGGFDVVCVCCSNQSAENFWQARLEQTIAEVTGAKGLVVCVHEDWNGGAGNGLGTLYAYQKACAKASAMGADVPAMLQAGKSMAIYHTAGKGTRLAPLPGAENNNKPGVKLPALLKVDGEATLMTILESVLRQTSSYAPVRPKRVSVFWGDQIFVPSTGVTGCEKPADILAALRPMPTKAEWEAEELHQYGLVAIDSKGSATQLEKVTYDVAKEYLPSDVTSVGTSLGSFSMSADLTTALCAEFATELAGKTASYDSDPHFWMPLTLNRANYLSVMSKKDEAAEQAGAHFDRMAAFAKKFQPDGSAILGCVDVGKDAYWWDYGRVGLYMENNVFVTKASQSAHALRTFFRLTGEGGKTAESSTGSATLDPGAVVLASKIGAGRVGPNSVLCNVVAPSVDVEGCVLMNVTSKTPIVGRNGLLYNVVNESAEGELPCSAVRADVFMPGGIHHVMNSTIETDAGKAWKLAPDAEGAFASLKGNPMSFEAIYKTNGKLDVTECTNEARTAHKKLRTSM